MILNLFCGSYFDRFDDIRVFILWSSSQTIPQSDFLLAQSFSCYLLLLVIGTTLTCQPDFDEIYASLNKLVSVRETTIHHHFQAF